MLWSLFSFACNCQTNKVGCTLLGCCLNFHVALCLGYRQSLWFSALRTRSWGNVTLALCPSLYEAAVPSHGTLGGMPAHPLSAWSHFHFSSVPLSTTACRPRSGVWMKGWGTAQRALTPAVLVVSPGLVPPLLLCCSRTRGSRL